MNIKEALKKSLRNCVCLKIDGKADDITGNTRLGGLPDVPEGFERPIYNGKPLSFLLQVDLEEVAGYDSEGLLPKKGLLSFFCELSGLTEGAEGAEIKDRERARVFLFENKTALHKAAVYEDGAFPPERLKASSAKSVMSFPDFLLQREKMLFEWDEFERIREKLISSEGAASGELVKLLGYAEPFGENMTRPLELIRRGYDISDGNVKLTARDMQEAEQWANRDQILLLQLDSAVSAELSEAAGGHCRMYFYIFREELEGCDFSGVRVAVQSA